MSPNVRFASGWGRDWVSVGLGCRMGARVSDGGSGPVSDVSDGLGLGWELGSRMGACIGSRIGARTGSRMGARVGSRMGARVGSRMGAWVWSMGLGSGIGLGCRIGTRVSDGGSGPGWEHAAGLG